MHTDPKHESSPMTHAPHVAPETLQTPPSTEPQEAQHSDTPDEKKMSFKSLLLFTVIVMAIVLPIRFYIAKPFIVSGASMYPTFNTWNYLIVDQLSYRFHAPRRGDVITFRFPQRPSMFLIKRIIGLPHETIQLKGTSVTIYNKAHLQGFTLNEPYVTPENKMVSNMTVTLGANEYFMMGDNRKVSYDSRSWGPLDRNRIVGRAYVRLFPFTKLDFLPGAASYLISTTTPLTPSKI